MCASKRPANTDRFMDSPPLTPPLPEILPRKGNVFSRWFGRSILRVMGWRVTGVFPLEPKAVVVVAPHTSNWDFVVGAAGVMAVGIRVNFLMKKEAFVWPLSIFFNWLGGIPLDRCATGNRVDQIAGLFDRRDKLWVGIAPEGTRKKVDCWKTGFIRIAQKARVPVLLVAWNYPKKEFRIDRVWSCSGDIDADVETIREYTRTHFIGRYPSQQ